MARSPGSPASAGVAIAGVGSPDHPISSYPHAHQFHFLTLPQQIHEIPKLKLILREAHAPQALKICSDGCSVRRRRSEADEAVADRVVRALRFTHAGHVDGRALPGWILHLLQISADVANQLEADRAAVTNSDRLTAHSGIEWLARKLRQVDQE